MSDEYEEYLKEEAKIHKRLERREKIIKGLKTLGRAAHKFIKESGKNQGKVKIFSDTKHDIKIQSKPYDFDKMNNDLLGKKRSLF